MGTTTLYGFPYPEDATTAKGYEATRLLAEAVETKYLAADFTSFTPTWVSDGTAQPGGAAARFGYYRSEHGWCDVVVCLTFGGSTSGGNGNLRVGLPIAASSAIVEQLIMCKLWTPSVGNWEGLGDIKASNTYFSPQFPTVGSQTNLGSWSSASSPSGGGGSGIPQIPGGYPIQSGGNFYAAGRYKI
jgi:hypothetical protein